jgi:hypothetical protein
VLVPETITERLDMNLMDLTCQKLFYKVTHLHYGNKMFKSDLHKAASTLSAASVNRSWTDQYMINIPLCLILQIQMLFDILFLPVVHCKHIHTHNKTIICECFTTESLLQIIFGN